MFSVWHPAAYHILSYGTLLGSTIFQSTIGGFIAFKTLSRPQFSILQQAIFPIFFAMQTLLPAAMALTYPASKSSSIAQNLDALLHESNRYSALVPIATMTLCGLINWVFLGPATVRTMRERKHQETRDGKKYFEAGPHSEGMRKLNSRFSMLHGVSSLVDLGELIAAMYYGFVLAERMI